MAINISSGGGLLSSYLGTLASSWSQGLSGATSQTSDLLNLMMSNCQDKVTMALEKVSSKVVNDLAGETAKFLADQPDLADNYVLVIIKGQDGNREARVYQREELVADLEGEEKEKALEKLEANPLLYVDSDEDLPPLSTEDQAEVRLAAKVQGFLDRNQKLLNLLNREGLLDW
ncbi:MAG: hypothetical protein AB1641_17595 [Thermodesulfobacteriota bacterium]